MPEKKIIQVGQPPRAVETRMYAPTDYNRTTMLAAIPFGQKGTARWFTDENRRILRYGLLENIDDPKKCVTQNFTITNDRLAMERVTMRDQLDSYEVVSEWEKLKDGEDMAKACITLTTRANAKEGVRPTPQGKVKDNDYESMTIPQLKTQIGLLQVKGTDGKALKTNGLSPNELVAHLRNHLAKPAPAKAIEIPAPTK